MQLLSKYYYKYGGINDSIWNLLKVFLLLLAIRMKIVDAKAISKPFESF